MSDEERWWPSPFGADDQLGMLNYIDCAKRRDAMTLVRKGRLYDLSRVLDDASPVFPGRYFRQTLVTTAHHENQAMPLGDNHVNWITEIVSATMQIGTHLDALSHLQIGDRGYNGWTVCRTCGCRRCQAARRRDDPPRSSRAAGSSTCQIAGWAWATRSPSTR